MDGDDDKSYDVGQNDKILFKKYDGTVKNYVKGKSIMARLRLRRVKR